MIRWAGGAALFTGGATLLFTLFKAFFMGDLFQSDDAWNIVGAAFVCGMGFGIYKKSRVCAVLLFVLYLSSSILMLHTQDDIASKELVRIVFLYFFARGVIGTFAYHHYIKKTTFQNKESP